MGFEILSEPSCGPVGTFVPRANQQTHRSIFVCVEGNKKSGWIDQYTAQQGIVSQDGRACLKYEEWVGDDKKRNLIKHSDMTIKEMIVPIEEAKKFEAHAGRISQERVDTYSKISAELPATDTQVGRRTLEASNLTVPIASLEYQT